MFRRRPGGLLNTICLFNLHCVSKGWKISHYGKNETKISYQVFLFHCSTYPPLLSMVPLILKNKERSHNIAPATSGWFLHIGGFLSPALNMSNTWSTWNQWIYYKNSRRCPLTKTAIIMRWYVCLLKKWAFNDNKVVEGF